MWGSPDCGRAECAPARSAQAARYGWLHHAKHALALKTLIDCRSRQHPPPHPRLYPGHHGGIHGRGLKGEALADRRSKHAIADAAVVVPVLIER